MELPLLPGSAFLQACFYGLASAVLLAASLLLRKAAISAGHANPAAIQRRFHLAAALWVGAVSAASYAGALLPRGGPPLSFAVVIFGVVISGIWLARSSIGDCFARGLPLAYLVGFQAFRFPLELAMHRAAVEGVMPVQMSYSGRNFDIVTGITALLVAVALAVPGVPRWVVYAWNWLGLLLLANIVAVAVLSTPVFAYFGPDRLNVFVMYMPYTLLPAVMVVAAWAGHLIIFRALSSRAASMRDPRGTP